MMIKIEPLKNPEELPVLFALARSIWSDTYQAILSSAQINYMLERMYAADVVQKELREGIFYGMGKNDSGIPVGFLSFGPYKNDAMKLHKLYLSPAYHGTGTGSMMLQYAIAQGKKQGYHFLFLNVNKQNARAVKAYRRNGFEIVREEKNDIGNGFFMDDYVMSRPI